MFSKKRYAQPLRYMNQLSINLKWACKFVCTKINWQIPQNYSWAINLYSYSLINAKAHTNESRSIFWAPHVHQHIYENNWLLAENAIHYRHFEKKRERRVEYQKIITINSRWAIRVFTKTISSLRNNIHFEEERFELILFAPQYVHSYSSSNSFERVLSQTYGLLYK